MRTTIMNEIIIVSLSALLLSVLFCLYMVLSSLLRAPKDTVTDEEALLAMDSRSAAGCSRSAVNESLSLALVAGVAVQDETELHTPSVSEEPQNGSIQNVAAMQQNKALRLGVVTQLPSRASMDSHSSSASESTSAGLEDSPSFPSSGPLHDIPHPQPSDSDPYTAQRWALGRR
ncbi:hypothetical protein C8F01DRAFT_1231359 [Mycena amicta]|nr:hypothetical protein C8F01DRAFT_1231359 [Mycena amicta]